MKSLMDFCRNCSLIMIKDWNKVTEAMAEQAIFVAKLLAGEMPQNIEEAFEAAIGKSVCNGQPRGAGQSDWGDKLVSERSAQKEANLTLKSNATALALRAQPWHSLLGLRYGQISFK